MFSMRCCGQRRLESKVKFTSAELALLVDTGARPVSLQDVLYLIHSMRLAEAACTARAIWPATEKTGSLSIWVVPINKLSCVATGLSWVKLSLCWLSIKRSCKLLL